MISPTELRIGNYVKEPLERIGRVLSFNEKSIRLKLCFSAMKIDSEPGFKGLDVEPIPLTPEILIKCGFIFPFEKEGEFAERSYHLKIYSLWEVTGNIPPYWQLKIGNNFTNTSIQFLHQLQNIYHALTGTELEINL